MRSNFPYAFRPPVGSSAQALTLAKTAGRIRRYGNIGMRIGPCGAMADFALQTAGTGAAAGTSFETRLTVAQHFDAVQLDLCPVQYNDGGGPGHVCQRRRRRNACRQRLRIRRHQRHDLQWGAELHLRGRPLHDFARRTRLPSSTGAGRRRSLLRRQRCPAGLFNRSRARTAALFRSSASSHGCTVLGPTAPAPSTSWARRRRLMPTSTRSGTRAPMVRIVGVPLQVRRRTWLERQSVERHGYAQHAKSVDRRDLSTPAVRSPTW